MSNFITNWTIVISVIVLTIRISSYYRGLSIVSAFVLISSALILISAIILQNRQNFGEEDWSITSKEVDFGNKSFFPSFLTSIGGSLELVFFLSIFCYYILTKGRDCKLSYYISVVKILRFISVKTWIDYLGFIDYLKKNETLLDADALFMHYFSTHAVRIKVPCGSNTNYALEGTLTYNQPFVPEYAVEKVYASIELYQKLHPNDLIRNQRYSEFRENLEQFILPWIAERKENNRYYREIIKPFEWINSIFTEQSNRTIELWECDTLYPVSQYANNPERRPCVLNSNIYATQQKGTYTEYYQDISITNKFVVAEDLARPWPFLYNNTPEVFHKFISIPKVGLYESHVFQLMTSYMHYRWSPYLALNEKMDVFFIGISNYKNSLENFHRYAIGNPYMNRQTWIRYKNFNQYSPEETENFYNRLVEGMKEEGVEGLECKLELQKSLSDLLILIQESHNIQMDSIITYEEITRAARHFLVVADPNDLFLLRKLQSFFSYVKNLHHNVDKQILDAFVFYITPAKVETQLFISSSSQQIAVISILGCSYIAYFLWAATISNSNTTSEPSTRPDWIKELVGVILISNIWVSSITLIVSYDLFIFYMLGKIITSFVLTSLVIDRKYLLKIRAAQIYVVHSYIAGCFLALSAAMTENESSCNIGEMYKNVYAIATTPNSLNHVILYLFFVRLAFCIKLPSSPFFMWLPETHGEASTLGSISLAGTVLKVTTIGVFAFILPYTNNHYHQTLTWIMFPLMACILGRFSAGRVNNLKFFIAYTSVMHMNAAIVSMLSCQSLSIMRAVCILVSHTLITSALFILNGYLYNRHSNYTFFVFGGLRNTAPLATFFFIFFTLANAALPFSSRFIGEFLMVSSTQANGPYIMVFWVIYLVSSIASTIWFLFRIVFGTSKSNNDNEENLFRRCNIMDLNRTEKLCLTVITFFVVFLRVLPFIMTLF